MGFYYEVDVSRDLTGHDINCCCLNYNEFLIFNIRDPLEFCSFSESEIWYAPDVFIEF